FRIPGPDAVRPSEIRNARLGGDPGARQRDDPGGRRDETARGVEVITHPRPVYAGSWCMRRPRKGRLTFAGEDVARAFQARVRGQSALRNATRSDSSWRVRVRPKRTS